MRITLSRGYPRVRIVDDKLVEMTYGDSFTKGLLWLHHLLLSRGMFFLHSAAISVDGKGFLFLGPSGSGKTTLARAAKRLGATVLSDEKILVKGGVVYPAFFTSGRKGYEHVNKVFSRMTRPLNINCITWIGKGRDVKIRRLPRHEALSKLMNSILNTNPIAELRSNYRILSNIAEEMDTLSRIPSYYAEYPKHYPVWRHLSVEEKSPATGSSVENLDRKGFFYLELNMKPFRVFLKLAKQNRLRLSIVTMTDKLIVAGEDASGRLGVFYILPTGTSLFETDGLYRVLKPRENLLEKIYDLTGDKNLVMAISHFGKMTDIRISKHRLPILTPQATYVVSCSVGYEVEEYVAKLGGSFDRAGVDVGISKYPEDLRRLATRVARELGVARPRPLKINSYHVLRIPYFRSRAAYPYLLLFQK